MIKVTTTQPVINVSYNAILCLVFGSNMSPSSDNSVTLWGILNIFKEYLESV